MTDTASPAQNRPRWPWLILMNLLPATWRAGQVEGMVENRRWLTLVSHVVVLLGVALVALPIYVTLVASTQTAEQVLQAPMSILPGTHLIENYATVLGHGAGEATAPVGRMM